MLFSTTIIHLDSECTWKGVDVDCTKVPYHRT